MAQILTPEDTVALKEDPSIMGIVEQSWRDIDSAATPDPREWVPHGGIREEDVRKAFRDGHIPKGMVIVRMTEPFPGYTMVKESDLILKDRGLVTGDVVKRGPGEAESGYVIKTELECTCRPVYTDLPYTGGEPWNHRPQDNEVRVPSEELTIRDYDEGKYVIYNGWIGEIVSVYEIVTVRLENGSIVRVRTPQDLLVPAYDLVVGTARLSDYQTAKSLATTLREAKSRIERNGADVNIEPEMFYPGQRLTTNKANLRLGEWIIGSYTPSLPPNVVVVDVRAFSVEVEWLSYNVFAFRSDPPPAILEGYELDRLKLYNQHNVSNSPLSRDDLGSRRSQGIVVGDYVAFQDPAGAAVKYSPNSPRRNETGVFRRIPRHMVDGFEMNTFFVRETKQRVRIQWQDGSITEQLSTDVVPYLNVDENDLWPGELCSLKSAETKDDGMIRLNQIGVVQSVNAKDRMVKVRWFRGSQVSVFEDNLAVLEPGSTLGELTDEVSDVSVYEVLAYSAITKRRGDLVIISPNERMVALQRTFVLDAAMGSSHVPPDRNPMTLTGLANNPQSINSYTDVRWFGEIIDLGLDGLLTVRLGALSQVEDIRVPVTRVLVVVSGDDEQFPIGPDDDFEDLEEMSEDMSSVSSEHVIEETIIYEGGERLDNDDSEDAWMTDEEIDEEELDIPSNSEGQDAVHGTQGVSPPASNPSKDQVMIDNSDAPANIATTTDSLPTSDYDFSKFSNKPSSFEILDDAPPIDHHFMSNATYLSALLLRRIRKEHKILMSSLPDGIWVRTWSGRLDILRILILGPRGTPYELAPFALDVLFMADFPTSPPQVFFHSWTNGMGRINPNLYEDGKVCLSILGTWPENEKNEGWNKDKSSLLQVLVSLMGLVLVEQPYYNEAGFESLVGTEDTQFASQMYTEKAYCMSKGFVDHVLRFPLVGVQPIVEWLYVDPEGPGLLALVVKESREALQRAREGRTEATSSSSVVTNGVIAVPQSHMIRLSAGAEILMKRFLPGLEKRLADIEAAAEMRMTEMTDAAAQP